MAAVSLSLCGFALVHLACQNIHKHSRKEVNKRDEVQQQSRQRPLIELYYFLPLENIAGGHGRVIIAGPTSLSTAAD